ncbi:MAG: N-acetylmuramoyl-L-alanine amidase [Steroidobacteraceae bacterium]
MSIRAIRSALHAGLLLLAAPALLAASRVEAVRLTTPTTDSARLELQLSSPARQKVFTLDNPHRVVIDVESAQLPASLLLPPGTGLVKSLRSGVQPGGKLRLVLELDRRTTFATSSNGTQLVVELNPRAVAAAGTPVVMPAAVNQALPAAISADPVAVRAAHAPGDAGRDIIIAIDAGHGGQDPGASGAGGTREKDVVLAIARALARRIDAEPGMRAVLTRNEDRFIPLRERMNLARRARADLFVSVHADAIQNRSVTGSSVYVLSDRGASSEAARWLAEQENAADLKGGVSLGDKDNGLASVLMDVSQSASIGASSEAAASVLGQLDLVGTIRRSQVQQAAFVVLKSPDMPSMLVETAFISNPGEEKKLRSPAHQAAVADAIFTGVRGFFRQSPPDGTLFARQRDARRTALPPLADNTTR